MQVDIRGSEELQAIVLALRNAEKTVQTEVRAQTRAVVGPVWQQSLASHASTPLETRALVNTARVTISNQNVTLKAAAVRGGKLDHGTSPQEIARAVEFGGSKTKKNVYNAKSRKGKTYAVDRRTQKQLLTFNKQGHVFYPAIADITPRILALWTQTAVRCIWEAFEGKQ